MALRDLLMLSAMVVMVPMIFYRPHAGIILWAWTAMLVPNTFLFGIGQSVRYNLIFALATLIAWFISKEPKKIPLNSTNVLLFFFLFWACLATVFGVAPAETRFEELTKLIKIVVFTIAIGGLVTTRLRVHALLFGLALGMGYHGVSEGAKFILSGGNHHVYGPARSIIGDNNHFALAMTFLLPIMLYLFAYAAKPLIRLGLLVSSGLVFVAIIGTFSRGGLIGLSAVGLYGLLKSKHKFLMLIALGLGLSFVVYFAPENWFSRMSTIMEADKDGSFMGRVIAWKISILLALDHPFLGGGITAITNEATWSYYSARFGQLSFIPTPEPRENPRAAHSVYFQLLADVGFVGLGIFLLILIRAWRSCGKLIRQTAKIPELEWINSLARAFQVSLLAYAVAGAALNMAYFEMFYVLIILVAIQESLVRQYQESQQAASGLPLPSGAPGQPRPSPGPNPGRRPEMPARRLPSRRV
ncbi:MAG: putative O-glycosylation ligase, exosortase A system-associated [Kiloniellaceae bacterium]